MEMNSELAALPLFSDVALWDIANGTMDDELRSRLKTLAELQKHRSLTEAERATLATFMHEAQRLMLCKAEAYRLLARRGYVVFPSSKVFP